MSKFFGNSTLRAGFLNIPRHLHDTPKLGAGGEPPPEPGAPGAPDLAAIKAQNEALLKRLEALEGKGAPAPKADDDDLVTKAKKDREAIEAKAGETKKIEAAVRFTHGAKDWLKTNAALLPKSIEGILARAETETFDSVVQKDAAMKVAVVSEFFAVQANLDLLTPTQKSSVEEYLKLTKNVKEDRAQQIYDSVFEPTFEMLKRIKKAEQISKAGVSSDTSQDAYKQKMIEAAKKRLTK